MGLHIKFRRVAWRVLSPSQADLGVIAIIKLKDVLLCNIVTTCKV